ncbi:MAG: serine protease, partial [Rhodospirillaceae bacterium]
MRSIRYFAAIACVASAASLGLSADAAQSTPETFADLTEELSPAVVNISTTYYRRDGSGPGQEAWDEWCREFFERRRNPDSDDRPQRRRSTSLGSGFINDSAGYVVSNNHVIDDADEV